MNGPRCAHVGRNGSRCGRERDGDLQRSFVEVPPGSSNRSSIFDARAMMIAEHIEMGGAVRGSAVLMRMDVRLLLPTLGWIGRR